MTRAAAELQEVPIGEIAPHPDNPRRSLGDLTGLAASIGTVGILQPLVLHEDDGAVTCLLGHRRKAAAELAGLTHVPARVMTGLSPDEQLETMVVENVQRQDLTPIEEAGAFDSLVKTGKSQRVVAERMGCDQSHVSRRLELFKLSVDDQERVHEGTLTVSKALKSLKPAKPKPEKAPAPAPVEVPDSLRPDPIDAMEPIGYKVIEIDENGEYADNWTAEIYATTNAARAEANTKFEGEHRDLIAVALVPLPPVAEQSSPSDAIGSVAEGEEGEPVDPVSGLRTSPDAEPPVTSSDDPPGVSPSAEEEPADPAPGRSTSPGAGPLDTIEEPDDETRAAALVNFARTWAQIDAADEVTVRESAEHEFGELSHEANLAVNLWVKARESLAERAAS